MEFTIRAFNMSSDVPELTQLTGELGYPTTELKFRQRMEAIQADPNYYTFIAATASEIIGYIGVVRQYSWEQDGLFFRIQALVVKKECRKAGVGAALISHVEALSKAHGAIFILVNSGNRDERVAAHKFYLDHGFEAKSTGFRKIITLV